jgi:hypothetical protein
LSIFGQLSQPRDNAEERHCDYDWNTRRLVFQSDGSSTCANSRIGVGFGMKPPQFLKPGNTMEITISEIGTLRNSVKYE